jgi:dienelactone hydrolase
MKPHARLTACSLLASFLAAAAAGQDTTLPSTKPLDHQGDLSAQMVAGIDKFLLREIERATAQRTNFWKRDFSSREAYEKSVAPNRERLRRFIGAVDERLPVKALELVGSTDRPAKIVETEWFTAHAVRWPVFEGVHGEGLWLQPKGPVAARVVALPDADQTPEQIAGLAPGLPPAAQFARRLAEAGCEVLVPVLIDRADTFSGNAKLKRFTNQPHREWIYRQAFEVGRHVVGYEVQKVLAAVDWFASKPSAPGDSKPSGIGVVGYGEGGLIALDAAALDRRVQAAVVSGYFDARERVWEEPIYRNITGLLREFGDAELASLVAPRALIIEHAEAPKIDGPPKPHDGRGGAAPGRSATPDFNTSDAEVMRARQLTGRFKDFITHVHGNEGSAVGPFSEQSIRVFLNKLGTQTKELRPPGEAPKAQRESFDPSTRQMRQVEELVQHTQRILRESERFRDGAFWKTIIAKNADEWAGVVKARQSNLWDDVLGRLPAATLPANARSRKIYDKEKWTGYDVVLDVWPDVFAWGVLLLPKDLKPGERRPVVVCQHGLEGLPADTITEDPKASGYGPYKAFSARLAERGFVVFAPHNPYRGRDAFRGLQRKLNPLGKSLFSVILAQHDRILDWLGEQPFVDPKRIGFYGLSYGGKTAMRVPALLDRYCLSICSADFNEWVTKNATVDSTYSYMFGGEYEIFEWDLGHTFNYAEMAACIAPRPFMVERGHDDGVAPDEWVAHEFARVRRFYNKLGIGDRAEIEFFNGPHTINGQGTYKFLHKNLGWPEPK